MGIAIFIIKIIKINSMCADLHRETSGYARMTRQCLACIKSSGRAIERDGILRREEKKWKVWERNAGSRKIKTAISSFFQR
jgi:hypothetical protein